MITIRKPIAIVNKIWGSQKIKNSKYRLLRYLIYAEVDEKILLYNVVSGELVLLNEEETKNFKRTMPIDYNHALDDLIGHHYLVPVDYDEHKEILQLRKIINLVGKKKGIANYVVLPTTYCNARCFYCYESSYSHINMTEAVAQKAVDFMLHHNESKQIQITWFGGEPLVGEKIISYMCDKLQQENVKFYSKMISNGYLFTEKLVKKAKESWNLTFIQITLDGTEKVYNATKAYVNVQDNPYERVLKNIDLLLDEEIDVHIRLNIGLHNISDIDNLVDVLLERFSNRKTIYIYAQKLFENEGFEPINHSEDDIIYLAKKIVEIEKKIEMHGMNSFNDKLPGLTCNRCMADNDRSILIYPDGNLYKCEHVEKTDCVGNLDKGITEWDIAQRWKKTTEFSLCRECPLVPECVILDGCNDLDECIDVLRDRKLETYMQKMLELYSAYQKTEVIS